MNSLPNGTVQSRPFGHFDTGQEAPEDLGDPGHSDEEIAWAREQGAMSDDDINEYIQLHKRFTEAR